MIRKQQNILISAIWIIKKEIKEIKRINKINKGKPSIHQTTTLQLVLGKGIHSGTHFRPCVSDVTRQQDKSHVTNSRQPMSGEVNRSPHTPLRLSTHQHNPRLTLNANEHKSLYCNERVESYCPLDYTICLLLLECQGGANWVR